MISLAVSSVSDFHPEKENSTATWILVTAADREGIQSAFEPHTSPVVIEHEQFAGELGKFLEKARVDHQFDALALVAPPQFPGLLKRTLPDQSSKLPKATIDKDLAQLKTAEIRS